jgi:hypothetical protein
MRDCPLSPRLLLALSRHFARVGREAFAARREDERFLMRWLSADQEASSMADLKITAGPFVFDARLETKDAPKTCASFLSRLPFESHVVHVRWSGEGVWIPLGDMDFKVGYENHTSYPAPGHIVLYPGGISETEILLAYGGVHFACKMGQLAGNHFITITSGLENLAKLGKMTLWEGARKIKFEKA